jgi:hypothetical protein
MTSDPTQLLLLFAGVAFGVFGVVALISGLAALLRARPLRFVARTWSGLLLAGAGTLALAVAFGSQGYRALTQEQPAGRIAVHSTGPQRFDARFVFPDGREATYALAGDEIYIDAHIIKWKPIANLVGLSTAYELDRIGGRYRSINQERDAERTVHPLAPSRPVDLFELRRRYAFLAPLFDAEYGSASFVPVNGDAELQLLVSPTGLLLRPRS